MTFQPPLSNHAHHLFARFLRSHRKTTGRFKPPVGKALELAPALGGRAATE
jgi:hypothetical protein